MRTAYKAPFRMAALAVTSITLSLAFPSCSKNDGDSPTPTPQNPSGKACRLLSEYNIDENHYEARYYYDSLGRIARFTDWESSGIGTAGVEVTTNVDYSGNLILLSEQSSPASSARWQEYHLEAGRIKMRVTGEGSSAVRDTGFFFYRNGRLDKAIFQARYTGRLTLIHDSIVYSADSLPVEIHVVDRDTNGRTLGFATVLYYDYDREGRVSFSRIHPLAIAPGIEILKADRMVKTLRIGQAGESSSVATVYDSNGNPKEITMTDRYMGRETVRRSRLEYTCN